MNCSNCGTENEAGRKFCKECGTALAVVCANCGTPNAPDAKFCGDCGQLVSGRAAAGQAVPARPALPSAAPAAAPVAERRLVSVLFADLVGFTTFAEGRDAEETRELLSSYFDLARNLITSRGGTVEKFIGDAVMAVWGAPVARENDAELAVRAALALVDEVRSLGSGIQARAGVLTGEAAVTIGAEGQGMVAGDLVNTASRLQSVAPEGSVLVGESTERAASQAIAFEPAGEQLLKGKTAPVPAFRALRVVAELGGRNRAGGLEAPFVGRDDDFALLKDLFRATARDKRPRLVSVLGPAGIGKSRLAWEFLKYIDGLVDDTYWHAGRSPSYGEGVTFWALGEMIRRRSGALESDDEPTTRQKLSATAREWLADETERRWVETAMLALLGLGEAPAGGRDELFAAWRTFFERIAERGVTVLLFEDLQWADTGMLDFIDHLLDWTKSLPIFVITLARPELLDRRADWGAGRRNFVSLALDPLPAAAMRELLEGLVPGLPDTVARTIIERADGIPLYAVETVRMLVADGRLREEAGVYRPVGELEQIAIPETLAALIAARLDGLDQSERSVLQDAAVLGQSFTPAGLAAVSGVDVEQLMTMLEKLVRREALTVNADPRSPEHGQYAFVQALIREVAYNQLAKAERKARHLAAARWFESLGEDELASALAGHYLDAYRNAAAGPEADALATQARIALRAAADRAARLGSHQQAVALLEQALELTSDPAERAALLDRAGHEAIDLTPEKGKALHEQALEIYRELGDLRGMAGAATGIAVALMNYFSPAEAIPVLEQVVEETNAIEEEPEGIFLLAELSRAYANTRHPRALELVDKVLERAERQQLLKVIGEGIVNRALVLVYEGHFYEPVALLRGVLPLVEAHGMLRTHMRALNNLAAGVQSDDIREAERVYRLAIEVSERGGSLGGRIYFKGGRAGYLVELGRWSQAEDVFSELADADPAQPGNYLDFFQAKILYNALRGEQEVARQTMDLITPHARDLSLPQVVTALKVTEAYIEALGGRLDRADRLAREAMAGEADDAAARAGYLAAMVGLWRRDANGAASAAARLAQSGTPGRVTLGWRREANAIAAALNGRQAEALAGFREGAQMWRDLEATLYLGLCLTNMAIALPSSAPEVAAAADEARQIWTELGSPPLLARLDEGLAHWGTQEEPGRAKGAASIETITSA
jgi:class 3 adenylate cyclase/tetratricopeptide (TPR) repeat protein